MQQEDLAQLDISVQTAPPTHLVAQRALTTPTLESRSVLLARLATTAWRTLLSTLVLTAHKGTTVLLAQVQPISTLVLLEHIMVPLVSSFFRLKRIQQMKWSCDSSVCRMLKKSQIQQAD